MQKSETKTTYYNNVSIWNQELFKKQEKKKRQKELTANHASSCLTVKIFRNLQERDKKSMESF